MCDIYVIIYIYILLLLFLDNVKALYKRGKAYIGVWNEEEAIKDLTRVVELDPTLQHIIEKELRVFSAAIKEKNQLEKKKLLKLFK